MNNQSIPNKKQKKIKIQLALWFSPFISQLPHRPHNIVCFPLPFLLSLSLSLLSLSLSLFLSPYPFSLSLSYSSSLFFRTLSLNTLQGSIPSSFGGLAALQFLYVFSSFSFSFFPFSFFSFFFFFFFFSFLFFFLFCFSSFFLF